MLLTRAGALDNTVSKALAFQKVELFSPDNQAILEHEFARF